MAPLPQNNTSRLFLDYTTGANATSQEHTWAIRFNALTSSTDDVQTGALSVLNAIGDDLFRDGWKVTGARYQAALSSFSLPVPLITALSTFEGTAAGGYEAADEASQVTFVGRSTTTGRRASFSLFTAVIGPGANFRFLEGPEGMGLVVRNVLLTLASEGAADRFLAIDGTAPNWYGYMNMNYNSYWETEIRG